MLDRVAAFFLNRLGGRQAVSAIAVIAIVGFSLGDGTPPDPPDGLTWVDVVTS